MGELFDHMINLEIGDVVMMTWCLVHVFGLTSVQHKSQFPTDKDRFCAKNIINYSSGDGERLKLAKRKLTSLTGLQGECGVQNDPKRL